VVKEGGVKVWDIILIMINKDKNMGQHYGKQGDSITVESLQALYTERTGDVF